MKIHAALLLALLVPSASATLINGSFEDGFNGWNLTGGGGRYTKEGPDGDFYPANYPFPVTTNPGYDDAWTLESGGMDGNGFGRVELFGYQDGYLNFDGPDGERYNFSSELSEFWAGFYQDVSLLAGQKLFGWARFGTEEGGTEWADRSRIIVDDQTVWEAHLSDIWNKEEFESGYFQWQSPWQFWEFTAPTDGTYHLQMELYGDGQLSSWGDIDGLGISTRVSSTATGSTAVPEGGSTLAFLVLSLVMVRVFIGCSRSTISG